MPMFTISGFPGSFNFFFILFFFISDLKIIKKFWKIILFNLIFYTQALVIL